jgi:hypothetical protein
MQNAKVDFRTVTLHRIGIKKMDMIIIREARKFWQYRGLMHEWGWRSRALKFDPFWCEIRPFYKAFNFGKPAVAQHKRVNRMSLVLRMRKELLARALDDVHYAGTRSR